MHTRIFLLSNVIVIEIAAEYFAQGFHKKPTSAADIIRKYNVALWYFVTSLFVLYNVIFAFDL